MSEKKINPFTNNPMLLELMHIFQSSTSVYYTFIAKRMDKTLLFIGLSD